MTKIPKKEKKGCPKEAGTKRRKAVKSREVTEPQHEKRSTARKRKSSSAEPTAGVLMIFSQNEKRFFFLLGEYLKENETEF